MKISTILGLNARSQLYTYRYNTRKGKKTADSKLLSARVLRKAEVPTPEIFKIFRNPQDIMEFDWNSLPDAFALKPSRGMGGEGIIVVKKRAEEINPEERKKSLWQILGFKRRKNTNGQKAWITTQRTKVTAEDLKLHSLDVLEGAFSMGNVPDVAFVQEYVGRHKRFRKFAFRGTPDIRIIVFNKVPVMAMLRLPTKESGGRANLHQGAIGVGIDIATGITTKAIWHGEQIRLKPGTDRKLHGIKIPNWTTVLETAVRAQIASDLGYLGVDIVLHPEKGPMVLEINAQPGLQIQMANMAGLKKRLERVEDLQVRDHEHGVSIAKALFAERFADRVRAEEGVKTIRAVESVNILNGDGVKVETMAKIDTGAWSSSIDRRFAKELGIYDKDKVLWYKTAMSSLGEEKRPVIDITFWLSGRKINSIASIANRKDLTYKIIIGRSDLTGFLVNPEITQN